MIVIQREHYVWRTRGREEQDLRKKKRDVTIDLTIEDAEESEAKKETNWHIAEVLRENGLLEKVGVWSSFKENMHKCPICEREFREGDAVTMYRTPIHKECLKKLGKSKKTNAKD